LTLGSKTEIWYFTSPETAKMQFRPLPRRGESETSRQSLEEFFSIKDLGNGIWKVFYRNVFLGFFKEKHKR